MEKKKAICCVCGELKELKGIMCQTCSDKIREDARGAKRKEKKDAKKEIKREGIPPKDD